MSRERRASLDDRQPRRSALPDGDTVIGAWVYPGGGGYATSMTRL